jgi:hypothetical protein
MKKCDSRIYFERMAETRLTLMIADILEQKRQERLGLESTEGSEALSGITGSELADEARKYARLLMGAGL